MHVMEVSQGTASTRVWWLDRATQTLAEMTPNGTLQNPLLWFTATQMLADLDKTGRHPASNLLLTEQPSFHRMALAPGVYYPRMARPQQYDLWKMPGACPGSSPQDIADGASQLVILKRLLEDIFRTVHPAQPMLSAYGHNIRNLLMLAATEVETQWRGILVANAAAAPASRLTTTDYVKLKDPLRLGEYAVRYRFYPALGAFRPFDGWLGSCATQSIPWYQAYNSVKHDREQSLHLGTLVHALMALAGCAIMLVAQHGLEPLMAFGPELSTFFELNHIPVWDISQAYYEIPLASGWTAINHPL